MRLSLLHRNGRSKGNRLPAPVRQHLLDRFGLPPAHVDTLRCIEARERSDGKVFRNIQVFSPEMLHEWRPFGKLPDDLQRHPEFVLYEGCMDERGVVHLSDRTRLSRSLGYLDSDDDLPEGKSKTIWF